MKIVFAKPETPTTGTYVVCVHEDRKLAAEAAALDKRMGGQIGAALGASRFKGRKGETLDILAPHGLSVRRVVLLGLGKPADLGALRVQRIGGSLLAHLNRIGESDATVAVDVIADAASDGLADGLAPRGGTAHIEGAGGLGVVQARCSGKGAAGLGMDGEQQRRWASSLHDLSVPNTMWCGPLRPCEPPTRTGRWSS